VPSFVVVTGIHFVAIIVTQLNYGHSNLAIEFNRYDYLEISESGHSSSEFTTSHAERLGTHGIASRQTNCSLQDPSGPRIQNRRLFSAAKKGLGECQKELPGFV
jgi:hypothetical protein